VSYSGTYRSVIRNGFFCCDKCYGRGSYPPNTIPFGKQLKEIDCEVCLGTGIRPPTWTEYIVNKDKLCDCEYNKKKFWLKNKKRGYTTPLINVLNLMLLISINSNMTFSGPTYLKLFLS